MADLFGTKGLGGFAYYDRMPDLGRPTYAHPDGRNFAAPFVVVFDKRGVRSIGNVGTDMEENQQGLNPQMMMSKSKSDIHYFFIFLRPTQAKKAEQLWFDAEYCDLYEYLKEIALTEEGAFGGEEGEEYPLQGSIKHKSWKHNVGAWFVAKDIRATEAVMNIHCEPDEEEEEPEKPSLGSLNWVSFSSENKVQGRIGLHDFLVWGARDGRSRVLGSPMDDWIWDEGEFEDEEQYEEFQRQVEQFGAYSLRHEIWDDEIEEWDDIDHITGIVPSEDYDLIQAAHEFFDLKNPILLGGMNWISLRAENLWKAEFDAEYFRPHIDAHLTGYGILNWSRESEKGFGTLLEKLKGWENLYLLDDPSQSTYAIVKETWNTTRKCSKCAARNKKLGFKRDGKYGAKVQHYNTGGKKFTYEGCKHQIHDWTQQKKRKANLREAKRKRRIKTLPERPSIPAWTYSPPKKKRWWQFWKAEFNAEDFPEDGIGLLNWRWDGWNRLDDEDDWLQMWEDWEEVERSHTPTPAAAAAAETYSDELLGSRTQSGVNSKYSSRSGTDVEEFSVPFIDISNQDADGVPTEEIICVDHLYHGQYSMGGEEITAHSPYWSPNLDFALGHALFGAELEKMVPATRCEYCYEGCDKCEEGWVLLNRETDDIIPQTMPMVLQLNFDTEEEICFAQDIEHEKGQSYVLYGESSGWEIVPSNQLIPILERWLEDEEIPEDILFDTGAGYVSDDRIVWNRVEQAIQQLQN